MLELERRKMKFEETKTQLKLEKLKLERKTDRSGGLRVVFGGARSSDIHYFVNKKDY